MALSLAGLLLTAVASPGVVTASLVETTATNLPPRIFAHPDRIHYDGHCLTIDGEDTIIFSGAFHYFRCPKALWRDRFQKIKDAGFNTVETYVPWNWHEREMPSGLDDFSKVDLTDLKDWLKMAHDEFGLYTIIRPGPYICAEWDGGGFPNWLLNFKPAAPKRPDIWMRSDDPVFLAWSKHWYDAVCPIIAAEQITHKPKGAHGVILFQIENEYDSVKDTTEDREDHLRSLYRDAVADGIDVPIFTCWTKETRSNKDPFLSQVFDGANQYPFWNVKNIEGVREAVLKAKREQPTAPGMVPELQGGWFSQIGGGQNDLSAAQINDVTLMAWAGGATITSYYMLYGGFNPDGWGARGLATSYDYNAPIHENGGVGDRYYAVKALGTMLKKYGTELARADRIPSSVVCSNSEISFYVRQNPDGHTFVFCFNSNREADASGTADIKPESGQPISLSYDLKPFEMKVLCLPENEWQPPAAAAFIAPPAAPQSVQITTALMRAETGAQNWHPIKSGDSLSALGVFDSRYILYRAKISLAPAQVKKLKILNLNLFRDDHVAARVNGQLLEVSQKARRVSVDVSAALHPGNNEIELLYENLGQDNIGKGIEDLAGLKTGALASAAQSGQLIERWRVKLADDQPVAMCAADVDDSAWAQFVLKDSPQGEVGHLLDNKNATAVFRATFDVSAADLTPDSKLVFSRIDDEGDVYINGQLAGHSQYWNEPFELPAAKFFKPGDNQIAVAVKNLEGVGGLIQSVTFVNNAHDATPLPWEISSDLGGVSKHWWQSKVSTSGWTPIVISENQTSDKSKPQPLATWYRINFRMPATAPNTWVAWNLKLNVSGNGWVYLNDHPLGRCWATGTERFYLPECWLNFGPKAENVVTLFVRSTDHEAKLKAASIEPYADFTETVNMVAARDKSTAH
jgi:hypothetical protein